METEGKDADLAEKRARGIEEYKKMVYEDIRANAIEREIEHGRWQILAAMRRALQLSDEEGRAYAQAARYEFEIETVKERRVRTRRDLEVRNCIAGIHYTDEEMEKYVGQFCPFPKPPEPQQGDKS